MRAQRIAHETCHCRILGRPFDPFPGAPSDGGAVLIGNCILAYNQRRHAMNKNFVGTAGGIMTIPRQSAAQCCSRSTRDDKPHA
jgi:hypothetical protein